MGNSKVSYTSADISPQIIDAGLEISTVIHKSPEEAFKFIFVWTWVETLPEGNFLR